jgi:hypothetical protein
MTTPSNTIEELVGRVEAATGPDRELDDALLDLACEAFVARRGWKLAHIGPDYDGKNESDFYTRDGKLVEGFDYPRKGGVGKFYHVRGEVLPWGVNGFRQDMTSAIAFAETMVPGAFWLMSKGRTRATEPLYAFQLLFGTDNVLGEGESNRDHDAIILATLRALRIKGDQNDEA